MPDNEEISNTVSVGSVVINLGNLSKPATVLIEKISDAVGVIFEPWQIERLATARAKEKIIESISKNDISKLEQRSLQRLLYEESRNQQNIEKITANSFSKLNSNALPEKIEKDWLVNFFNKCRLISDEEVQNVWSNILAGEANNPGKFSKRTINLIASIDGKDAMLFTKLCGYNWLIDGEYHPLVYNLSDEIYKKNGINFDMLNHLDTVGLISFNPISSLSLINLPQKIPMIYQGIDLTLELPKISNNTINVGQVILTSAGKEVASICYPEKIIGMREYVTAKITEEGVKVL